MATLAASPISLNATTGAVWGGTFVAKLSAWNARRITKARLNALSDDMLRDIGLTRAELAQGKLTR